MPARERGANLDTSRRIGASPRQRVAMKAPSTNLRSTALSSEPFKPAQQQAQRTVVKAQRALPKEPTPDIPKLSNPTPAQSHAALALAQEHQRASGKPAPTYWQELRNDPRQRAYLDAVAHYARAAQGHEAAQLGRKASPEHAQLARDEAVALGRQIFAGGIRQQAEKAPFRLSDHVAQAAGLPPAVGAYIKARTAEDIPALAKVGSAIATLATHPLSGESNLRGKGILGNALLDIADVGRFPLIAGTEVGKAAVRLGGTGSTQGFQDIGANVVRGLKEGAVGRLVQGDPSGALRALHEHPIMTPLEVAGVESALGRTAGALTRAAGGAASESALGRLGSTVRSPIALSEDAGAAKRGMVKERTLSKDLNRSALQLAIDRRTRKPVIDPQTGKPVLYSQEGQQVPVLRARSEREERRLQQHRANEEQGLERDAEVYARAQAGKAEQNASRRSIGPLQTPLPHAGSRLATDIAAGLAEGAFVTAKSLPKDLRERATSIEEQIKRSKDAEASGEGLNPYRSRKEREVAEHAAAGYRKAASDPKLLAKAQQIEEVGLHYAQRLNELDPKQAALHIYDPQELERARLSTYAVAQMGAKRFTPQNFRRIADEASVDEQRHAATVVAGNAHIKAAEQMVDAARLREKLAALANLERRPGAEGEGSNATRAADKLTEKIHAKGIRDFRSIPSLKQAETNLVETRQVLGQATAARERAKARRLAVSSRGSLAVHDQGALRNADGSVLSNEAIRAHARAHGRDPSTIAYLPHKPGGVGKGAYHKQPRVGNFPVSSGMTRTFSLFNRGAHKVGREVVHEELVNKATTVSRAQHALQTIRSNVLLHPQYEEWAAKKARGEPLTRQQAKIVDSKGAMVPKDARELAQRLTEEGKPHRPVKLLPAKLSKDDRNELLSGANPARMESVHETLLQRHLVKEDDNSATANAGVIPGHLFDRHEALVASKGQLVKAAQLVGGPFRIAVLAQPKWLTGDFVEPQLIRLPIKGAGLVNIPGMAIDIRAQKALIRRLESQGPAEREAAQAMRAVFHGSVGITGRRGASVRRTYEDLTPGFWRDVFKAGHAVRELPVIKTMADLGKLIPESFFGVNSKIGELAQRQAFGKNVRMSIQEHTGSWMKSITLANGALDDVAKGLLETPRQIRYAEQSIDMLGRYSGYGPGAKAAITTLAPFIPWVLNSLRFVYWTLPAHHSTLFVALQKEAEGVLKSYEAEHADTPPGELRYALHTKDGGLIPISKYLPYSISVGLSEAIREPHGKQAADAGLQTFTNSIGPQVSGVLSALSGKDFTGEDLRLRQSPTNPLGQAGILDRLIIALNQGAGATIPNYSMAQRLLEGGGTAYGDSTLPGEALRAIEGREPNVKPGSKHQSALNRTLNPLRPTYLRGRSGGGSSSEPTTTPSPRQRLAARRRTRSSGGISARQRLAQRRRTAR